MSWHQNSASQKARHHNTIIQGHMVLFVILYFMISVALFILIVSINRSVFQDHMLKIKIHYVIITLLSISVSGFTFSSIESVCKVFGKNGRWFKIVGPLSATLTTVIAGFMLAP